jgi:hypothetical protein
MNILDPIFYRTLFYDFRPVISPGVPLTPKASPKTKKLKGIALKISNNLTL